MTGLLCFCRPPCLCMALQPMVPCRRSHSARRPRRLGGADGSAKHNWQGVAGTGSSAATNQPTMSVSKKETTTRSGMRGRVGAQREAGRAHGPKPWMQPLFCKRTLGCTNRRATRRLAASMRVDRRGLSVHGMGRRTVRPRLLGIPPAWFRPGPCIQSHDRGLVPPHGAPQQAHAELVLHQRAWLPRGETR